MSDARSRVLQRVREACRTARVPEATAPELVRCSLPEAQWLERFRGELEALNSRCSVVSTESALHELVHSEIAGKTVLGWDPERLPYGLSGQLDVSRSYLKGSADGEAKAAAEVGLTGVALAAAETGSIVLMPRSGEPRTASLLPLKHIAIVRADQMRADLAQCLEELQGQFGESSQVNVITGQSRSADIELSLILGMHGPAELHVIVGP
ncbi:MAG: lactate utilization protein [Planctomycetota bacterium]